MGEPNAKLFGSMSSTRIYLAHEPRTRYPSSRRLPHILISMSTSSRTFANETIRRDPLRGPQVQAESPIAHQYIEQMAERCATRCFGNVGTTVVFRVGAYDADVSEKEFAPTFMKADLVNLGQRNFIRETMRNHAGDRRCFPRRHCRLSTGSSECSARSRSVEKALYPDASKRRRADPRHSQHTAQITRSRFSGAQGGSRRPPAAYAARDEIRERAGSIKSRDRSESNGKAGREKTQSVPSYQVRTRRQWPDQGYQRRRRARRPFASSLAKNSRKAE